MLSYHRNIFILLHTRDLLKNSKANPIMGRRWENADSWMRCCLPDAALGSFPVWVVGRRRDWVLIHPELPPRGECQEEASPEPTCAGSANQPAYAGGLGRPGPPGNRQSSAPLFPLSALFFLKTTCGSKLVRKGRVLPLVSFWLEIYFSVHALRSCTWQNGVCSAVHSLANLMS